MPITMKLELGGLFAPGKFSTYQRVVKADINYAVVTGMEVGGQEVVGKLRSVYAASVRIRKKSFPKAIGWKLFANKKDRFPDLWIGSQVKAVAAHAFGAHIAGPVLIPLLGEGQHMGEKTFALIVRYLMRGGNAEFRRVNGKTILFAEQGAATQSGINIGAFRRAERARRGGEFRKQKGKALEVPIAVLVRNVKVKQSFPFRATVRAGLPTITAAIQRELNRV